MASLSTALPARASYARRVLICCALVAFLDGFDTQAIAPAAPAIARQLGVAPAAMGPTFAASQIGFLIGAFLFGALGDRHGRKRMLLVCTGLFTLGTLGTALAGSMPILLACRLLAGLGLGGASPNFVSLASEFAAPERRARVVTMLWAAVPLGGMAGAFTSGLLLPRAGWHAVFLLGASAPCPCLSPSSPLCQNPAKSRPRHTPGSRHCSRPARDRGRFCYGQPLS
jgi:AAHS family 4-hydroxybenzoate transporter-like MFS transporter